MRGLRATCYTSALCLIQRISQECSCFIEFIKRVGGKEIKCEACELPVTQVHYA